MRSALAVAILFCVAVAACDSPPAGTVIGKWVEQSGATWEFTADGKVIIKGDAKPTYTLLDDGMLKIEFHDSQSLAVTYKYELSEQKLILSPEEASGEGALPRHWDEPTVLVRQ
jgi:hypothetical protein